MQQNRFLLVIMFVLLSSFGWSQDNWEFKKEEDGIKVYTRKVEGASLDAFKGEGNISASLETILAVLRDGDRYTDWSPDCTVSVQKENTAKRQVNYSVTEAPFPVSDRDAYVELTFDTLKNGIKIHLRGIPDYAPEDEDYVRIQFIKGFWLLQKIDDQTTKVTYQLQADPGGSIPTWLANATAVDQPFKSIQGLREVVE